jgi:type IV secretory pathway VirB2 component (pilin)
MTPTPNSVRDRISVRNSVRIPNAFLAALTLAAVSTPTASAATGGGGGGPATLTTAVANIMEFMTGPIMVTVITIAIAIGGLSIIFSDRMGDQAGRFGKILLGGTLVLSAPQILSWLGFTAATI